MVSSERQFWYAVQQTWLAERVSWFAVLHCFNRSPHAIESPPVTPCSSRRLCGFAVPHKVVQGAENTSGAAHWIRCQVRCCPAKQRYKYAHWFTLSTWRANCPSRLHELWYFHYQESKLQFARLILSHICKSEVQNALLIFQKTGMTWANLVPSRCLWYQRKEKSAAATAMLIAAIEDS